MKKIKRAYYYLFYKFYKMSEAAPSKWWSHGKASFSLDVLIYFIVISLFVYYKVFFNRHLHLSESNADVFLLVIPVALFNYFIFHHRDQWKDIVEKFDRLPKEKNRRWGLWVWAIVIFLIANLIFSFFLMSQIDWSQYK